MLERDELVVSAVPELNWNPDGIERETPGCQVGISVAPPTLVSRGETVFHGAEQERGEVAGQYRGVYGGQERGPTFEDLFGRNLHQLIPINGAFSAGSFGFVKEQLDVIDVVLAHSREVVEPGFAVGRNRRERGDGADEVW
jgi:hypothetical protein